MQNSGTKLVLGLLGVAWVLGMISWWYRYETAHRASQFWGPEASRLIAESEGFEVVVGQGDGGETRTDLSKARGQAHVRHALLSDGNYVWDEPEDTGRIEWQWTLRFHEGGRQALVMLSKDLKTIGRCTNDRQASGHDAVAAVACEPMTASLQQYFAAIGLLAQE